MIKCSWTLAFDAPDVELAGAGAIGASLGLAGALADAGAGLAGGAGAGAAGLAGVACFARCALIPVIHVEFKDRLAPPDNSFICLFKERLE